MESLSHLSDTLSAADTGGRHDYTPQDLSLQFKEAARQITALYTEAAKASKKAYKTGYASALQDVLEFLQCGLDHHPPTTRNHKGKTAASDRNAVTIERVIDYIEARRETVRSLWEEEFGGEPPIVPRAPNPTPNSRPHAQTQTQQHQHKADPSSSRSKSHGCTPRRPSPASRNTPFQERDRKFRSNINLNISPGNNSSGAGGGVNGGLSLKRRRSLEMVPVVPITVDSDTKVTEILMGDNLDESNMEGYGNEWAQAYGERPFKRMTRR